MSSDGILSGTFTQAQLGTYSVTVKVKDGYGGKDERQYTLKITDDGSNNPPAFISQPIEEVILGEAYSYIAQASDIDGDTLSYSLVLSPTGMQIDTVSGEIYWSPVVGQEGAHIITARVEDGQGGSDEQSYTLSVTVPNTNPLIISTPVESAVVDAVYSYNVIAEDADGDTLTYSVTGAPTGLSIDSVTGIINWSVNNQQSANRYSCLSGRRERWPRRQ